MILRVFLAALNLPCEGMHVPIERLYEFVMDEVDLTDIEQSHLIRCSFCVAWLDACVTEKVSQLSDS